MKFLNILQYLLVAIMLLIGIIGFLYGISKPSIVSILFWLIEIFITILIYKFIKQDEQNGY